MSKFKVGSLLRNTDNNQIGVVHSILDDAYYCLDVGYIGDDDSDNVEIWTPRPQEWCWIHTRRDSMPFIGCFLTQIKIGYSLVFTDHTYTSGGKRKDVVIEQNELITIEPFIGTLPRFIKERL